MLTCDLHVHLDGSIRESTLVEFARAQGICPGDATDADFLRRLRFEPGMTLSSCLGKFETTVGLLQSRPALTRVAEELARDCYLDGVRHIEVRLSPPLHTKGGMAAESALEAVLQGLERGAAACASGESGEWMSTGVVLSMLEGSPEREAASVADLAARFAGSGVLGLDLAGDESLFDARRYRKAFERARAAGLGITVHAGEGHDASHVVRAVRELGADRIGHGTSAGRDPSVMELLAERGTTVECCLSSNVHTGAIRSPSEHPLREFMRRGVKCTLATDNRFFSRTTLSGEYDLAAEHLNLGRDSLAALALDGARASFLPPSERDRLVGVVSDSVSAQGGTGEGRER